jgi:formate hydrogenlyase subunit 6/NADH:ubiquinone oxidoreductase subunit I
MLRMEIREEACRGCEMCVDVCPTRALVMDTASRKARVQTVEDCIACLSCSILCPSGAILHGDYHAVKNFYRDLDFSQRVERFL